MGTWGSTQQAAKWASFLSREGTGSNVIEYVVIALALGAILMTVDGFPSSRIVSDDASPTSCFVFWRLPRLLSSKQIPPTTETVFPVQFSRHRVFFFGRCTATFYGFFPLYFPELFPTSVRATGQGFCFNFGRIIAAIGSLQFVNLMGFFGSEKIAQLEEKLVASCSSKWRRMHHGPLQHLHSWE